MGRSLAYLLLLFVEINYYHMLSLSGLEPKPSQIRGSQITIVLYVLALYINLSWSMLLHYFFGANKGIRQGDPFYPYLFITGLRFWGETF